MIAEEEEIKLFERFFNTVEGMEQAAKIKIMEKMFKPHFKSCYAAMKGVGQHYTQTGTDAHKRALLRRQKSQEKLEAAQKEQAKQKGKKGFLSMRGNLV